MLQGPCVGAAVARSPVSVAGPRCEDPCGPLAASSVSWLKPGVFSRGQATLVGLTSTGLRATAAPTPAAWRLDHDDGFPDITRTGQKQAVWRTAPHQGMACPVACNSQGFRYGTALFRRPLMLTRCGENPCGGQADRDRLTGGEASGDRARSRTSRPAAHERHRSAVRPPQPGFATQRVNTDCFQDYVGVG